VATSKEIVFLQKLKSIITDINSEIEKEIIATQFHLSLIELIRYIALDASNTNLALMVVFFKTDY
jgi:hypothetical protein